MTTDTMKAPELPKGWWTRKLGPTGRRQYDVYARELLAWYRAEPYWEPDRTTIDDLRERVLYHQCEALLRQMLANMVRVPPHWTMDGHRGVMRAVQMEIGVPPAPDSRIEITADAVRADNSTLKWV